MTRDRCSTCKAVLLWTNHRLICPRPHCPGHAAHTNTALSTQAGHQQNPTGAAPPLRSGGFPPRRQKGRNGV